MLKWLLRRFRYVQDLEFDGKVLQRAFDSAGRQVELLESLAMHYKELAKDRRDENSDLRKENARLRDELEGKKP